jgi:hypothetical protein
MLAPCANSVSTPTWSCSADETTASSKLPEAVLSQYNQLNKNGVIRAMIVTFEEKEPPPQILGISSISSPRSIRVIVSLNGVGLVYCQAFRASADPPSVEQIMSASNSGFSTSNKSVITITQLDAAAPYVVYCLTSSLDGGGTTSLLAVLNR